MCLILLAVGVDPEFPLVLAANRDEFHSRPTLPAAPWPDAPEVVAGRDLRSGGTWLGVATDGRWAAVTNFRDAVPPASNAPSRGRLVADFLQGGARPTAYAAALSGHLDRYDGVNLLLGAPGEVVWISNRSDAAASPHPLGPGIYGLSNHLLETPWPKVVKGKERLRDLVEARRASVGTLLDLLRDATPLADREPRDTGLSPELARALSAPFVLSEVFGTRASTALLVASDGTIDFAERSFDAAGEAREDRHYRLVRGAQGAAFEPVVNGG